ncbi:amidohydrolase [Clostridium sp. JS66]|uniref:amidohydrolase n=1 Tax=Clostridium sp. JS66 TaxID=3064705 RepID=UPI00298E1CC3|nr:amidohydrolase [Clostridium sp. JS66]WPC40317.1 amidohydrolase [Clostridium sp. JS66]
MKSIDEIKKAVCKAIDDNSEKIIDFAKQVGQNPELGFKEKKTAERVANFFSEIGLSCKEGLALTGVKAKLKNKSNGINVAILGELDAVICKDHKDADKTTGAAHACGHNLQLATMIGSAVGLKLSGVEDNLDGNVTFMAVPAEECIEVAYRQKLKDEGKIHFFGGKQELISLGEFDDVNIAMMMHSSKNTPEPAVGIGESSNGFLAKTIQYVGKTAHAAEAPHEGVNALNAAMLGLMGVNALRETFRDEDSIRVHPIITKGGDVVNSVPDDVRVETYVRAKTVKAMNETNEKVDRALMAGGYAIGAETIIKTIPGYLPLRCSIPLNNLFKENCKEFLPEDKILNPGHFNASTDMGDVSHLIPTIHPYVGGVSGCLHAKDFKVEDYYAACILPAKFFAMTVVDLLVNNAKNAKNVIDDFKPVFSKEEYVKAMDQYYK